MSDSPAIGRTHVVNTESGPVRGRTDAVVNSWRSIPYAQPPLGSLRWHAPRPHEPWKQVRDAVEFGAVCPQPDNPAVDLGPANIRDEDCLTLSVWTSATTTPDDRLPVMVWIHGGAYLMGSGSQPLYDASHLVADGAMVVVTVNYRLGPFGFLDVSQLSTNARPVDSNLGLRDVIRALEWVRDNVGEFGGDSGAVTLAGESAGGGIVTTLLATPAARGLFHRAIAQSSPAGSVYGIDHARRAVNAWVGLLGVTEDPTAALDADTDSIVAAGNEIFAALPKTEPGVIPFAPTIDGDLVPENPLSAIRAGRGYAVPLLIGTNRDEAAAFKFMRSPLIPITDNELLEMMTTVAEEQPDLVIPSRVDVESAYSVHRRRDRGVMVAGDLGFRMPTLWLVDGHWRHAPVYLYRFDWATPLMKAVHVGATHATELPYTWGNLDVRGMKLATAIGGRKPGEQLSERLRRRWEAFVTGGEPNTADDVDWPAYTADEPATLLIDREDAVRYDVDDRIRAIWGEDVISF